MRKKNVFALFTVLALFIILLAAGCSEKNPVANLPNSDNSLAKNGLSGYNQINLVSDISYPGARIDPNLQNAWGIAVTPNGRFWISANHTGLSVIYDSAGNQVINPVTIPTVGNVPGGSPTGQIFNTTSFFRLPNGNVARFIFVGEDGIVSAWEPSLGSTAMVVSDQSASESVYKGVELAQNGNDYFLYAANFRLGRIDVFDTSFVLIDSTSFYDPGIPAGYAPFNIKEINGKLYVTYAKQLAPDLEDDDSGPARGFVDIYTTSGDFVSRFASHGTLNSPWGIAVGHDSRFGPTILIGNFGDGRINVFRESGQFMGQLRDSNNHAITIEGLWALFTSETIPQVGDRIYFSAGPNDEANGLFGYLSNN
ncbi:MAG TPA: TIGR03118 family protein [Ignavibacteriaceae bacterium]|nr:TIGR03118 family protein [Ignavibacteriaceae bacterium]